MVKHQCVEGYKTFDAALVQGLHHLGQFGEVKADLGTCRKVVQAKVDGIRACFDGGLQFGPMSGRAHQFRFYSCSTHAA